jgi:hypothetical protein
VLSLSLTEWPGTSDEVEMTRKLRLRFVEGPILEHTNELGLAQTKG